MSELTADTLSNAIPNIADVSQVTLEQILLLSRHKYDEKTAQQVARSYCLQSSSDDARKKGMEFLYVNGYDNDLQQLINRNKESENLSTQHWAAVYQLTLDQKQKRYPPNEILRRTNRLQTDEPELQSLIEFIKIIVHYRRNAYGEFGNFLEKQQKLFNKINDPFLLSSFNIRLYQHLFVYYLFRNAAIVARKYAFQALNQMTNPGTQINMHIHLGLSYVYDTYEQGIYHLYKALEIARAEKMDKQAKSIEQRSIPFLSAHFGRFDDITTTDKSEQAHIELAKGNYAKAETILKDVDIDSPFKLYYLGMAKRSKGILLQSYNSFVEKRNDYFFSRLPLNALYKLDMA
ncbi:AimR family lysis-lysogeny pheromone receptor [Lentibacillus cibarius]|uniref:Tetratricopeptide repeat protein n=1 Tax=Lentibacillus cibarius TaxID=2583219 RepID=A0A5S3QJG6_9BACI|nr:AimR family lysis-lysogeny pheromone receptor [Lentibacillus cibarius]TMN21978.1 hypothetical protein FFL34_07490 [Lentibacillus cibarius]